jgi:hypothetical protein
MFTLGRQREKQHAASYVRSDADTLVIGRVIDATHDVIEGSASADAVAQVFAEAFLTGGSGVWEQTGSWLCKLAGEHPSLARLWLQLAPHKSARIRFRVAAFLNDMPDDIRQQLAATFLADPSAKVRSKTAGEISTRPTADVLPLLQSRITQETDSEVLRAIQYALTAYATTAA